MPTYVLAYHTPERYAPTPETTAAWMAWFDSIGDHVVKLGKPTVAGSNIGNCSPEDTELGGYSLISADDLETAVALAKGCPSLEHHGGVEIGELGEVPES